MALSPRKGYHSVAGHYVLRAKLPQFFGQHLFQSAEGLGHHIESRIHVVLYLRVQIYGNFLEVTAWSGGYLPGWGRGVRGRCRRRGSLSPRWDTTVQSKHTTQRDVVDGMVGEAYAHSDLHTLWHSPQFMHSSVLMSIRSTAWRAATRRACLRGRCCYRLSCRASTMPLPLSALWRPLCRWPTARIRRCRRGDAYELLYHPGIGRVGVEERGYGSRACEHEREGDSDEEYACLGKRRPVSVVALFLRIVRDSAEAQSIARAQGADGGAVYAAVHERYKRPEHQAYRRPRQQRRQYLHAHKYAFIARYESPCGHRHRGECYYYPACSYGAVHGIGGCLGFSALCYWSAVCESEAQRADRRWPSAAAAYGERAFRHGGSRGENVVDYGYVESFEFFGTAAFYHSGYVLRRASRERRVWVAWARTATRLSPTGMPVASDMPPGYFLALVVAPPEVFAVVHGNGQQNVDSLYGRWRVGYQFCGEGTSEARASPDGRNTWRGVSAAQTRSLGCSETTRR